MPFQKGHPPMGGRPEGSISPITKIRQIFKDNPESFDRFVREYMEDPQNRRHLVEMLDGKPKQPLSGDIDNPVIIKIIKYGDNSSTPV